MHTEPNKKTPATTLTVWIENCSRNSCLLHHIWTSNSCLWKRSVSKASAVSDVSTVLVCANVRSTDAPFGFNANQSVFNAVNNY